MLSLVAMLCILALEFGGNILFARQPKGSPYSLFYQTKDLSGQRRTFFFPYVDPLLGWGRHPAFQEYFSEAVPDEERTKGFAMGSELKGTKRIIGLGGSTTDPQSQQWNWVHYLAEECSKRKEKCQALNGGILGYSTTQEFLKLVRDALPLKPDLVISLNGINDYGLPTPTGRTFVNAHQEVIENSLRRNEWQSHSPLHNPPNLAGALPHIRFLAHLLGFFLDPPQLMEVVPIGTVDNYPRAKRWETNVRMMHAVSKEMGVQYFVFLQPYLPLEPKILRQFLQENGQFYGVDPRDVARFYDSARAACRKMSYCADLSIEFQGKAELWMDPMHLYAPGHEWEAKRMMEILRARGFW